MNESAITLSICIPTFNRCRLLRHALTAVVPQVHAAQGSVELLILDNHSTDDTPLVASKFQTSKSMRYIQNSENIGAVRNVLRCVEQAQGQFVWIIGDDDLVREDTVTRVLSVIHSRPDVDYVYVNVSTQPLSACDALGRPPTGRDFALLPAICSDLSEHGLQKWEELIDPDVNGVFLGSIMSSVFRRSLWLSVARNIDVSGPFGSSLETVYPHVCVLTRCMVGRPVYYLGYPCVVAFQGHQEWLDHYPAILVVTLHEMLDMYLQFQVSPERIDRCRRHLLLNSGVALMQLLLYRKCPGRDRLFFIKHLQHYWRYREFWRGLAVPLLRRARRGFRGRRPGQAKAAPHTD